MKDKDDDQNNDEKKNKDFSEIITETLAIEIGEAKSAGKIGFISRALTQATLPHRRIPGCEFSRSNGNFTLSIVSPSVIGLPYGNIPRLLVSWVTSEAVRMRSPILELGSSLSHFMRELGLTPTGGRWGSVTRLREQMLRLFASSVTCIYSDSKKTNILGVKIVSEANLWWDPKSPDQIPLWKSNLRLGQEFYNEIINNPIPIDMGALKSLKRSPMALDIYCWLTYRMSYLRKQADIPWPVLEMQFGADYKRTTDFRINFIKHLRSVLTVYPEANVEVNELGLVLKPSKPHVAQAYRPPLRGTEPRHGLPRGYLPFEGEIVVEEVKALPAPPLKVVPPSQAGPVPSTKPPAILLATETYEKAKKAAPGWDVYSLEQEWRVWIADKERPKNPDAAFIGFCKQRFQKKGKP
ncbi:MAG: hypothetical protein H6973_18270 [Gammaproteobacteria bacterium]|nr:hypothetical protein [Gammaproteobacteria bacterium]